MKRPKHGDTGFCAQPDCGQPIQYWDANPGHLGAHWFHDREPVPVNGGYDLRYCSERRATP